MINFDYTPDFAGPVSPFSPESPMGRVIVRAESTLDDFLADESAWVSETGNAYSEEHMRSLWDCVVAQKARVQALWLVARGVYRAFNPALASLS